MRDFKHDSWAATALYAAGTDQVVCKFNRRQRFGPISMRWLGRRLAHREAEALRRLSGVSGVPRLCGAVRVDGGELPHAVAHEFVPGHPLGDREHVNSMFFDRLMHLLDEVHRLDLAYVDLHKRENIIVGDDGQPYLIDFQISFILPSWWPANVGPGRYLLRLLQRSDRYHLQKHFARCRPDQCGHGTEALAAQRPWWIRVHRCIARPFRSLRRWLLVKMEVRNGRGRVDSEHFPEEVVRAGRRESA